jgi:hypothetical protein
MKTFKHNLFDLKEIGRFPMPERSAHNAKAEWPVEPVQDKDLVRQNLNDGSVSVQQRSQELADEAKFQKGCDDLLAEINLALEKL